MANPEIIGRCCLCGEEKPLTLEHVPPKNAFNDDQVLMHKLDITDHEAHWVPTGRAMQGGYRAFTLCKKCNNDTGGWYGRAYVEFARACAQHANPAYANQIVGVSATVFPLRVMKQALVMMCSCCGVALTDKHPDLRRLLLHKTERGLPRPMHLFAYVRCDPGGRSSGVSVAARVDTREIRVVAECAWWPVGLVLSFNEVPVGHAMEVTHWLDHEYSDKRHETILLPCRWAGMPYPLDQRSPEEVRRDMIRDEAS